MTERLLKTGRILQDLLDNKEPVRLNSQNSIPAAVLMPLWDQDGQVQMIFTKRTSHLPHHGGQISFPGGAREPQDPNMLTTALRETQEEIGVGQSSVQVVARLDQVVTISNFLVTPFLGLLKESVDFNLNPHEVERLVVVPLAKVLDKKLYQPTDVPWDGSILRQRALPHNGDIIWGATARMLMNLLDTLGDEAAQVAAASTAP